MSFDGAYHALGSTCTYVLVKVCHSTMDLPFFKITGKNGEREGQTSTFYLRQLNVNIFGFLVTLQQGHRVLVSWVAWAGRDDVSSGERALVLLPSPMSSSVDQWHTSQPPLDLPNPGRQHHCQGCLHRAQH